MIGRGGIGGAIAAIIIVLIAMFTLPILISAFNTNTPTVKIAKMDLTPTDIKVNGNSLLTVTIENLDKKTHNIELFFDTNPKVKIFSGAESLLSQVNNQYYYNFSLESADPDRTKQFAITAGIDAKTDSQSYPITIRLIADGKEIARESRSLKVTP
jgi:hypothetical protein